jgi:hypothetical protein
LTHRLRHSGARRYQPDEVDACWAAVNAVGGSPFGRYPIEELASVLVAILFVVLLVPLLNPACRAEMSAILFSWCRSFLHPTGQRTC